MIGSEYSTPTAAARAVGGGSAGLTVWKRTSNGQKLSDVWKAYRLRTALRPVSVLARLPFIDGFLLACEPFDRKFRTIRALSRFRENIADTIANRAFA